MISFVRGTVVNKSINSVIIDVSGIGFKILVPSRDAENIKSGEVTLLNTYFSVKEDSMELYGFLKSEDLDMFNLLIGVNGVGPKAALSLLSAFSAESLSSAIMLSDGKKISSAQGIGKKTAERIILELKDKVSMTVPDGEGELSPDTAYDKGVEAEALSALKALGYTAYEAAEAVKRAGLKDSVEDTIKAALLALMR